jgi:hypothetical protein
MASSCCTLHHLNLYATDKSELLDQVREYAYAKGAMAGTKDLDDGEIAQIGRSSDVLLITKDEETGETTFTVSGNSMFKRSVLVEYKGQVKSEHKISNYWTDEVESVQPLFLLKFTNQSQMAHLKECLSEAEKGAVAGYNDTRGTVQFAHSGGGWPTSYYLT